MGNTGAFGNPRQNPSKNMVIALPSWLRPKSRPLSPEENPFAEKADPPPKRQVQYISEDTPIICAGGCGQIIGYLPKGHKVLTYRHSRGYEHWCPECESADRYRKDREKYEAADRERQVLALLGRVDPDVPRLRLAQISSVAVIALGSGLIAAGNIMGVYLAGTGIAAFIGLYAKLRTRRQ